MRLIYEQEGTGKLWSFECEGESVSIEAGQPGKLRSRTKTLKSEREAIRYANGERLKKLRDGYRLHRPDATRGELQIHRLLLSRAHTGMLHVAGGGELLFCGAYTGDEDHVLGVDSSGSIVINSTVPTGLVFDTRFSLAADSLFLLAEHQILEWTPSKPNEFLSVSKANGTPASDISLAGGRLAFYEEPNVVVLDLDSRKRVFELERDSRLYGGHSSQMTLAMHPDGKTLALCCQPGQMEMIDIESGNVETSANQLFAMVEQLEFDSSGTVLIGVGNYGPWGPLFFDPATGKLMEPCFELPEMTDGRVNLAMDTVASRIAISSETLIHVFEVGKREPVLTVDVDTVLGRVRPAFWGDRLVGRTDQGCLAVYPL